MSAAPLASVPLAVNGAPCLLHRVRFRSAADGGGLPLLATLRDPQPALAVLAQRIELSEDAELPETAVDDELLVIFANAGLQTGHAWRQRLEAWMAAGEDERQPTLEAPSFGERVLWRPAARWSSATPSAAGSCSKAWPCSPGTKVTCAAWKARPRRPGNRPRPMSN